MKFLFYIKAKFLLYIFVFHVLDGSISYPVWIKRTVVVNYYKANDISWQVFLPSCACWFFPWPYCFYKCTNSYWNDETLVCTALTRTLLRSVVPSVDIQLTVSGITQNWVIHFSETQGLYLPRSRIGLVDKLINSLRYLAMGNLTVNVIRMSTDDLELSCIY